MELDELILLAAASLFRASDGESTSGGRTPGPDPYLAAVRKAKILWKTVIAHNQEDF